MALIECPECKSTVSDTAAACPRCGAPVAAIKAGRSPLDEPVTTIQLTGRALKAHLFYSSVVWWIGLLLSLLALYQSGKLALTPVSIAGFALLAAGFIWYLVTRIRIWWLHR